MTSFLFRLSPDFVDSYRDRVPPFGYRDAGGNSLGEITFLRTYSRLKEDGSKETWTDVCERVINGMFSIQKEHCKANRLPWNDNKAQHSAQDAFDRLFNLKWSPPGRGLWMMGTPLVMEHRNSAALQNCSFISTNEMSKNDPSKQSERGVGPIPVGTYVIGQPFTHATAGTLMMRLSPLAGTNTFGRSGFLIHGDSRKMPGSASRGCIVLPHAIRRTIWESMDHTLEVVSGETEVA